ncbi:unnamed protein product [Closterium sp. NIES-53]
MARFLLPILSHLILPSSNPPPIPPHHSLRVPPHLLLPFPSPLPTFLPFITPLLFPNVSSFSPSPPPFLPTNSTFYWLITLLAIAFLWRPFIALTALSYTFYWLITLLAIAFLWRPFIALTSLADFFLLLLILSAVAGQELSRQLLCRILFRLERGLNTIAAARRLPPLSPLNTFHLSLATGLGHGIAHSLFLFLSVSSPAIGPATFYPWRCPQLPLVVLSGTTLTFLLQG